jgi:hypothetical protein
LPNILTILTSHANICIELVIIARQSRRNVKKTGLEQNQPGGNAMNFNVHYYDQLAAEHRQGLQHEWEQKRLLASLPHDNVARRAAGRLGVLLVVLGTRLEEFDRRGKTMAYDLGK